jgi:hypothetical protein
VHAMLYGITTTNKKSLDSLYRDHDESFSEDADLEERLTSALETLRTYEEIHRTSIMKAFQVYSLLLALSHVTRPIQQLQEFYELRRGKLAPRAQAVARLTKLIRAVDDEVQTGKYAAFVRASSEKTNVKAERATRFTYYCEALLG